VLTASDQGTTVEAGTTAPGQAPLVRASPGWLVLAVYGRVRLDRPAFDITGGPETAARFAAVFGPAPA
jgi:hypothetical protein